MREEGGGHRIRIWFQHDDCPAHNALIARAIYLSEYFLIIGLGVVEEFVGWLSHQILRHLIFFCRDT